MTIFGSIFRAIVVTVNAVVNVASWLNVATTFFFKVFKFNFSYLLAMIVGGSILLWWMLRALASGLTGAVDRVQVISTTVSNIGDGVTPVITWINKVAFILYLCNLEAFLLAFTMVVYVSYLCILYKFVKSYIPSVAT